MDVSVIIVNYNTKQMTAECIESIFAQTKKINFEIILIDNGSTDGSKDFFEKDPRIIYKYSEINLGFGKANNIGYKHATGKYIFLLNSDTLLLNNAIFEMYNYMEKADYSIGCVGCIMQSPNGELLGSYYKNFPTLTWIFQENLLYAIPKIHKIFNPYQNELNNMKKDKYPLFVNHICGADLFIRRETIEKCGMFDPDFFMYYEETEMQFRFHKNGYKSIIINSPKIIHFEGASSSKEFNLKKFNMNLTSRFLYAKKTYSPLKQIAFRLIHFILIPRLLLSHSPWKEKKKTLKIILG